jgi:hypothetical protein
LKTLDFTSAFVSILHNDDVVFSLAKYEGQTTIRIRAATAAPLNRTDRKTTKMFITVYPLTESQKLQTSSTTKRQTVLHEGLSAWMSDVLPQL